MTIKTHNIETLINLHKSAMLAQFNFAWPAGFGGGSEAQRKELYEVKLAAEERFQLFAQSVMKAGS